MNVIVHHKKNSEMGRLFRLIYILGAFIILSCGSKETILPEKPEFYFDGIMNDRPIKLIKEEAFSSLGALFNNSTTGNNDQTFIHSYQGNAIRNKDTLMEIVIYFPWEITSKTNILGLTGKRIQGSREDSNAERGTPRQSIAATIRLTINDTLEYAGFEEVYEMNELIINEVVEDNSFEIWDSLKDDDISATYYVKGAASFSTLKTKIVNNEAIVEETDRFIKGEFAIRLLAFGE